MVSCKVGFSFFVSVYVLFFVFTILLMFKGGLEDLSPQKREKRVNVHLSEKMFRDRELMKFWENKRQKNKNWLTEMEGDF